ncbi:Virulence protein, partial [Salmonella enterica subsp. enterica serovar Heidelberg str. 92-0138]
TYIEATFNDGYVATSQVYITPDEKYPQTAPPSVNTACQTLPGRGLGETIVPIEFSSNYLILKNFIHHACDG